MQLSTRFKDYVIDTIALRSEMYRLNQTFTSPKTLKIMHGCSFDIKWLQKDFGIYVVNLFDTAEAAKMFGLQPGFRHVLKYY